MDKQYKSRNEKIMIFETKIYSFWAGFGADFKPSILKQDKGVWFSGVEMPENAVRQSLSAFRFVILLRMISNSYAVKAVFRRKSRFLRIHLSIAVWWLKIEKFWQRCEQKLRSLLKNREQAKQKLKTACRQFVKACEQKIVQNIVLDFRNTLAYCVLEKEADNMKTNTKTKGKIN